METKKIGLIGVVSVAVVGLLTISIVNSKMENKVEDFLKDPENKISSYDSVSCSFISSECQIENVVGSGQDFNMKVKNIVVSGLDDISSLKNGIDSTGSYNVALTLNGMSNESTGDSLLVQALKEKGNWNYLSEDLKKKLAGDFSISFNSKINISEEESVADLGYGFNVTNAFGAKGDISTKYKGSYKDFSDLENKNPMALLNEAVIKHISLTASHESGILNDAFYAAYENDLKSMYRPSKRNLQRFHEKKFFRGDIDHKLSKEEFKEVFSSMILSKEGSNNIDKMLSEFGVKYELNTVLAWLTKDSGNLTMSLKNKSEAPLMAMVMSAQMKDINSLKESMVVEIK